MVLPPAGGEALARLSRNTCASGGVSRGREGERPHAVIPQRRSNKQVVDKRTPAPVLHAIAEGEHQVPSHVTIQLRQPHLPKLPRGQEREKCSTRAAGVQRIPRLRIELVHQIEEVGEVGRTRLSHHNGHWLRLGI